MSFDAVDMLAELYRAMLVVYSFESVVLCERWSQAYRVQVIIYPFTL